ncbi:hypothetical protein MKW92_034018, partial [Papaver armeniacum]
MSTLSSSTKTTIDSFSWKSLGLNIKWLEQCLTYLNDSIPGFGNFSDSEKGKRIINRFLLSDMKLSCGGGDGMLPKDIDGQHGIILHSAFLLQVNEIEDITYNPDDRLVGVPPGFNRILMLSMTDGVQCVFSFEDRTIKDLQVFAPLGFKVVVDNVKVREGFLVLEPGHLKLLGGVVEHLEAKRLKSEKYLGMQDWIKATSTHDAWKPNGVGGFFIEENSTCHDGFSSRSDIQDLDVEKMDAIPYLPEPKELTEKQSVGPQKEMAWVMDAGNTFRAKASLEQLNAIIKAAGTTCAAADTTCESVLQQIKKYGIRLLRQECLDVCRKKVDETVKSDPIDAMYGECHGILLQIQQECFNVYQRKFDQEKKSRDNLVKEMDPEKEELTLKNVREEKFADVQSQIQEILEEHPEEAKVPTVEAEDLSWKSLEALETQLLEQSSRVKFRNKKKILDMAESVVCDIRNHKRKELKKEKEMTPVESNPEVARRKITSLFDNSEEMLVQLKNWMSACKLYSWLEDYNREENSYISSSSRGENLNLYRVIEAQETTQETLDSEGSDVPHTTEGSNGTCPTDYLIQMFISHLLGKGEEIDSPGHY